MIINNIFNNLTSINMKLDEVESNLMKGHPGILLEKLDEAFAKISQFLEENDRVVQTMEKTIREMKDRAIYLYGKVHDQEFKWELTLLAKEAFDLDESIEQGNLTQVAKRIDELKNLILDFERQYSPSINSKRIVLLLKESLGIAENYLQTGEKIVSSRNLEEILRLIESEENPFAISPEEAELMMEIFETTENFQGQETSQAKKKLMQLLHSLPKEEAEKLSLDDSAETTVSKLMEILMNFGRERDPYVSLWV